MKEPHLVIAEVSARHAHLTAEDIRTLFGKAHLTVGRELSQPGEFAAREVVTLSHDGKTIENVRVVGPARATTQVELSATEARGLGYFTLPRKAEYAQSGGALIRIQGTKGSIERRAAYIAARHLHCDAHSAVELGLSDGDYVAVRIPGERGMVLEHVVVRVAGHYHWRLHLDTDEGNAAGLRGGEHVEVLEHTA